MKWSALGERGICRPGASRTRTSIRTSGAGGDIKTYCQMWELYDTYYVGNYYVYGSSPAFGNFDIGYSITPVFGGEYAPYGWLTHRAKCNEGGAAYIAATSWAWWYYIAPVLYESATVPAPPPDSPAVYSIDTTAIAEPGYEVSGAEWDEGGLPGQYSVATGARSVDVKMAEMSTLEVKVVVEGGGLSPAEAGHVTADEAKRWYSPFGDEYVLLEASSHGCRVFFDRWSGEGVAYGLDDDEPDLECEMPLDDPDDPLTMPEIWILIQLGESRTVTAHFKVPEKPEEKVIALHPVGTEVGSNYGIFVKFIYKNAAGWWTRERVTHGTETSGCTKCSTANITARDDAIKMEPCDWDGNYDANGQHGFFIDSIKNNNGPPWLLYDAFRALGKDFPCCNTTEQIVFVGPVKSEDDDCYFQYEHTQFIKLTVDDSSGDSGTMEASTSGAEGVTVPWQRLW